MVFRFGISQVHGGGTVIEGARAFTAALARLLGEPWRLHVAEDYAALQQTMRSGGVDLAWLPPFIHIEAARYGAHLIAVCERAGALTYRSSLLVRVDDPVREVSELRGVRVAWTDRSSASGYVFPRLLVISSGVPAARAFSEELFLGSPREVCGAVADGRVDLGACFTSEAHADDPKLALADVGRIYPAATWRLRVLAVTAAIPSDGMVLAPALAGDAAVRGRVRDALLRMNGDSEGMVGLAKLLFADRLVGVTPQVVRAVEQIAPLLRGAGG
jgi:phosphonate transport system substrate-binding protein